ncbi:carbon-nitrogen hydrolase family protein [Herbidospora galbida]|uniref:Carbon-nitrogen hydrolase family protein n=1 Tax=Herbidospora galbida TaxID=2575442 RepID=A0A4U3MCA6_9ACTN|nr:carbon-nitrogen hydrolase family protein [Herbidospora galbida]TKK86918.1 carbon-nitrogen hydrolase family protein [Herbidospora galbida]
MTVVALGQIPIDHEPKKNLETVREALASAEADLVVFPEATLSRFGRHIGEVAEPLDGPFVTGLREAAREYGTAVIAGVWEPDGGRVANTAVAVDADGSLKGAYRKIHLFDSFGSRESEFVSPGPEPVVAEVAGLRVGLATCYDVRFPELFRKLVDQGADVFAVIAAWAAGPLKEDHWTTMVRARAIENTTWTVAVGQPPHADGFGVGHSMLVDPMGVVTRALGPTPGVGAGVIDAARTETVRAALPSLLHRRFTIGDIAG